MAATAEQAAGEETSLHFVTGAQRRATYRPAALRTNSSARLDSAASAAAQARREGYSRAPASEQSFGATTGMNNNKGRARSGTTTSTASTATFASTGGGITRDHWQPDASATACTACSKPFTFLSRRHHCRRCGMHFCSTHSRYTVLLAPDATFVRPQEGREAQSGRACPRCRREYELFLSPPIVRRPSGAAQGPRPTGLPMTQAKNTEEEEGRSLPAQSVPSDWTWSTF